MTQLTLQQRLQKVYVSLMKHNQFVAYSGVMMIGDVIIADRYGQVQVETAGTDGRNVIYNPDFIAGLTDAELRGLVLHETKHKMYLHPLTWRHLYNENPELAMIATDCVINLEIIDESKAEELESGFIKLPDGGCWSEKFRGMDAGQIYRQLQSMTPEQRKSAFGSRTGGGDPEKGMDEHGIWDPDAMSEDEQESLKAEVDSAIRQGAIMAGKVAGQVPRNFDAAMQTKIDWRQQLADFISAITSGTDQSTWRRPNRRYLMHDMYMPTSYSETVKNAGVHVDTSGSISSELNNALAETDKLLQTVWPERLHLLYWDHQVAGHEIYTPETMDGFLQSTRPVGGGGTSPSCITAYLEKNRIDLDFSIVFTDGYVGSDWGGKWDHPVIWVIIGNDSVTAPHGVTIHIDTRN